MFFLTFCPSVSLNNEGNTLSASNHHLFLRIGILHWSEILPFATELETERSKQGFWKLEADKMQATGLLDTQCFVVCIFSNYLLKFLDTINAYQTPIFNATPQRSQGIVGLSRT